MIDKVNRYLFTALLKGTNKVYSSRIKLGPQKEKTTFYFGKIHISGWLINGGYFAKGCFTTDITKYRKKAWFKNQDF